MRAQERERARVARVLDGDGVARVDERARDEVEPLLRAVHDEERVGVGRDAPPREPLGERLAERPVAERRAVGEERAVARDLREERGERRGREIPLVGREAREVVRRGDRLGRRRLRDDPQEERRRDAVPRGRRAEHGRGARAPRDARAAALVRLDPALALEDLERLVDRRPVHFERAREVAGRGEALALEVLAPPDVADDRVRDRPVERDPRRGRSRARARSSPWPPR